MKILSIDLDYLMPHLDSHPLYLEAIKHADNPQRWAELDGVCHVNFLAMNLLQLILTYGNPDKMTLINEHQEILNIIGSNTVDVINIDQHHDIFYSNFDQNACYDNTDISLLESCWVYYLYVRQQLNSYKWVANSTSRYDNKLLRYPFSFYICDEMAYYDNYGCEFEIESDLRKDVYDCIVFVKSPKYLPVTSEVEQIFNAIEQKDASLLPKTHFVRKNDESISTRTNESSLLVAENKYTLDLAQK